jgi:hypothetical protein
MADNEFDTRRAMSKKREVLDRAIDVRNRLNRVINEYYDFAPGDEAEARSIMAEIRTALIDAEKAYSRLADTI